MFLQWWGQKDWQQWRSHGEFRGTVEWEWKVFCSDSTWQPTSGWDYGLNPVLIFVPIRLSTMLGTYKAHILLSNQWIGLCKNLRKPRKRVKEDSGNGTRLKMLYIETCEYLSRMLGVPQLWSICRQYFSRDWEHWKGIGCSECVSACACPHWHANNKLLGKEIQWVLEFGPEIQRERQSRAVL